MNKSTDEELKKAYRYWLQIYEMKEKEKLLQPFLSEEIFAFSAKQESWIKLAREALFISATDVADNLKITRKAFSNFEAGEAQGTITLNTLAKVADAMDCELVYAIRPKRKKLFSQIIWEVLAKNSLNQPAMRSYSPKRMVQALVAVATSQMNKASFRKSQGWSQRKLEK